MKEFRPVDVPAGAYNFCKYTIALSLWASVIFRSKALVAACFIVLVFSAILKVRRAPLVFIYRNTVERVFPSKKVILEENAICFAHKVGAVFSGAALVFLYFINPFTGWVITAILALLKTSGALGFCGAAKLYGCLNNPNGKCCRVGTKVKKCRDGC